MSISDAAIPPHWQYYSDRASEAHEGRADDLGQGREEQLNETLLLIESGKPFTDEERKRLDNLPHNRAKKHARLLKRTEQEAVVRHPRLGTYTVKTSAISYYDDHYARINGVHESLTPAEWLVECLLAAGGSYADVAGECSGDALKMRVSRWRMRLRKAHAN
jgi:hypothetical protein